MGRTHFCSYLLSHWFHTSASRVNLFTVKVVSSQWYEELCSVITDMIKQTYSRRFCNLNSCLWMLFFNRYPRGNSIAGSGWTLESVRTDTCDKISDKLLGKHVYKCFLCKWAFKIIQPGAGIVDECEISFYWCFTLPRVDFSRAV